MKTQKATTHAERAHLRHFTILAVILRKIKFFEGQAAGQIEAIDTRAGDC